jgi:Secretion system C-terminal sorting domain
MKKLALLLVAAHFGCTLTFAQSTMLQHPGAVCCAQEICQFDPIELIAENLQTTPTESELPIEYAWYELVDDSTTATGTKWVKIPNTNTRNYQPLAINSQYGGFFMRAARKIGTLPYLFSNIVNVKVLSPSNPLCVSASAEVADGAGVVIAPNPASTSLRVVNQQESTSLESFQIFDISGKVLMTGQQIQHNNHDIDVTNFASGLYFLQLFYSNGKTSCHKWVKS